MTRLFHNTQITSFPVNQITFSPSHLRGTNSNRQILHGRVFPVQNLLCIPREFFMRGKRSNKTPLQKRFCNYAIMNLHGQPTRPQLITGARLDSWSGWKGRPGQHRSLLARPLRRARGPSSPGTSPPGFAGIPPGFGGRSP